MPGIMPYNAYASQPRVDPIYYGNRDLQNALGNMGQWGNQAGGNYLSQALAYNPQASINASAQGQYNLLRPQMNEAVQRLRGQQVGMGRLDTGFATQDEDRLVRNAYQDLNDRLMANSMQGEQLRFQNMQGLGQYGQNMYNSYANNLAGLVQSRAQQDAMDRASRRQMWGNIIGGGLGAIGSVVGGFL